VAHFQTKPGEQVTVSGTNCITINEVCQNFYRWQAFLALFKQLCQYLCTTLQYTVPKASAFFQSQATPRTKAPTRHVWPPSLSVADPTAWKSNDLFFRILSVIKMSPKLFTDANSFRAHGTGTPTALAGPHWLMRYTNVCIHNSVKTNTDTK